MKRLLVCLALISTFVGFAQKSKANKLYKYGITSSFANGMYEGSYPVKQMKKDGNLGIGASAMLDGELILLGNKVYRTTADGKTTEESNSTLVPLSLVTHFKAQKQFKVKNISQEALYQRIKSEMRNPNACYAIKVSGVFTAMQTRAYPRITENPAPKIADVRDRQVFFDFSNTQGVLAGFYFPTYLKSINSAGFHLHYLSADATQGGHTVSFSIEEATVEIAEQSELILRVPDDEAFRNFEF